MCHRMRQRECQRGDGLSSACGYRQGKKSRLLRHAFFKTGAKNFTSLFVQFIFCIPPGSNIFLQSSEQLFRRLSSPARCRASIHKGLCIQIVCVHQTGIQHSRIKSSGKAIRKVFSFRLIRKFYLLLPFTIIRNCSFLDTAK